MAGAIGAFAGAGMQADAARDAANMQKESANKATNQQWAMYQQNRADQAPWRATGASAVGQLGWLMGLSSGGQMGGQGGGQPSGPMTLNSANVTWVDKNGNPVPQPPLGALNMYASDLSKAPQGMLDSVFQASGARPVFSSTVGATPGGQPGQAYQGNMSDFGRLTRGFDASQMYNDPGYQFRLQEGQKALERSGAARGMSLSGAQLKGIGRYSQDYASNEYGNAFNRYNTENTNLYNRLSNLAGMGQVSANNIGQFGQNTANQMGQYMTGSGNAMGASAIAQGNAWSNAFNSGMNAWNQYSAMNNHNQGWGSWWGGNSGGGTNSQGDPLDTTYGGSS